MHRRRRRQRALYRQRFGIVMPRHCVVLDRPHSPSNEIEKTMIAVIINQIIIKPVSLNELYTAVTYLSDYVCSDAVVVVYIYNNIIM